MKRIITAAVFALMISLSVFAEVVIEADGRGETFDEAKENAIIALAEKVFPNTVVTETGTETKDGDGGYSASFSQKSSRSVVGELPGIDCRIVSSKRNSCTVSAEIRGDERTLAYYTDRLEEQKTSAEEFYERYTSLSSSESATTRRKTLALVIEYYYYFNIYSNIILRLGGNPMDIDIPTTIAVLQVDYESLLAEEENELRTRSNVSSITREIEEELQKNREAQEEYRKAQEESNAQAELQRKLILDQKISEIISSGDTSSLEDVSSLINLEGLSNYLDVIQSANYYLAEASSQYDALVEEQTEYIEESFSEEAEAIRNRTYPLAYLSNGKPTETAKALREDEVSALREQKDREKEEALETINDKLCDEIQKRYNYLYEAISALSEKEFCVYSKNGEVRFSSTPTYDAYEYAWLFSIQMDEPMAFSITGLSLTYTDLTGKKIPTDSAEFKAFYSSAEYQDTVETYDKLLNNGGCDFSVSFRADVNLNGYLSVTPEELTMTFRNGESVTISLTDVKTKVISLGFDESSYLSYTWLDRTPGETAADSSVTASVSSSAKTAAQKYSTSASADAASSAMDDALDGDSSISMKVSTTTSSSSVSRKSYSGGKIPLSFGISTQYGLAMGSIYSDEMGSMYELDAEFRVYCSALFGGCTVQYSKVLGKEEDGVKTPEVYQIGVYPVVGVRLFERFVVACRMGYNRGYGIVINPYATVSLKLFTKDSSLLSNPLDMTFMGGCYIVTETGKIVAVVGMTIDFDFNR